MNIRRIKAKWATKLMKSKHFVLLTDKESVICFQNVDPTKFSDIVMLEAQRAELANFSEKLDELILRHRAAIRKLSGGKRVTNAKTSKKSR